VQVAHGFGSNGVLGIIIFEHVEWNRIIRKHKKNINRNGILIIIERSNIFLKIEQWVFLLFLIFFYLKQERERKRRKVFIKYTKKNTWNRN